MQVDSYSQLAHKDHRKLPHVRFQKNRDVFTDTKPHTFSLTTTHMHAVASDNQTTDWDMLPGMKTSSSSLYGQHKTYTGQSTSKKEEKASKKYFQDENTAESGRRSSHRGRPRSTPRASVKYELMEDFILKASEVSAPFFHGYQVKFACLRQPLILKLLRHMRT
jgi:hypothetical protein